MPKGINHIKLKVIQSKKALPAPASLAVLKEESHDKPNKEEDKAEFNLSFMNLRLNMQKSSSQRELPKASASSVIQSP